jgi:hypothetical protein
MSTHESCKILGFDQGALILVMFIGLLWFLLSSSRGKPKSTPPPPTIEGYSKRPSARREAFESGQLPVNQAPGAPMSSMTGVASSTLKKPAVESSMDWSEFAPSNGLEGATQLLEPHRCIGQDTVSNHLRNASYDLRSEPPNPTHVVSPWINTTIGPDLTRRPLEM